MGKIKPKNTSQRLEPSQTEPNGPKRSQTELTGTAREASRHLPWVATDKKSSVKHRTWDLRTLSREVLCADLSVTAGPRKPRRVPREDPAGSVVVWKLPPLPRVARALAAAQVAPRERGRRRSISPRDVDDVARARFPRPYRASGRPDARGSSNGNRFREGCPAPIQCPGGHQWGREFFFSVFLAPTSRSALADAF